MSTGAQDDLSKATDLARRMVRELGMSEAIGLTTVESRSLSDRLMGAGSGTECSDATLRFVDAEVSRLLDDAHGRAKRLVSEHRASLERVAQRLLAVETISGDELRRMLAEPPPVERLA
jgi:cell division protease FtsH